MEARGAFDGDPEAEEQFDREVDAAAAGDWEAIGLDAPTPPDGIQMEPTSIEELRNG